MSKKLRVRFLARAKRYGKWTPLEIKINVDTSGDNIMSACKFCAQEEFDSGYTEITAIKKAVIDTEN